ncbi:40S ribosomal protein s27-2 [Phtheirospermum japonicum]|uniref:40S ribosomal protein s27-2 n=1 Tax=Phtheirospermum japonicum TaxID=374723 RepID=A0A830DF26_9LAMI|nr:40S ribosomal protein s27-2 [Phtheirospermum japonicum]
MTTICSTHRRSLRRGSTSLSALFNPKTPSWMSNARVALTQPLCSATHRQLLCAVIVRWCCANHRRACSSHRGLLLQKKG